MTIYVSYVKMAKVLCLIDKQVYVRIHVDKLYIFAWSRAASWHNARQDMTLAEGEYMFEEWAPGMEIHTSGACWSVGHTTVEGHSRGRGPSYQPAHAHTSMWVCASVG